MDALILVVGYFQSNDVVALYYARCIKAFVDQQLLNINDGSVQNTQISI